MAKNLLKRIIIGGLIVEGILGLTGCVQQPAPAKPNTSELGKEYFSDKGLIYRFSNMEADNAVALAVGDMDGDGDNDILIAKSQGTDRGVKYLENIGGGMYADRGLVAKFSNTEANSNVALAVKDMDGDGDLDILIAKSQGTDRGVRYIENNIPQKNR